MWSFMRPGRRMAAFIAAGLLVCAGCQPLHEAAVKMPPGDRSAATAPGLGGVGYESLLRARGVLEASARAHGSLPRQAGPASHIAISYTGTLKNKGHYARPGQIKELTLSGVYEYSFADDAALHEGSLREKAEPGAKEQTSRTVARGARALERDYGDEKDAEVTADRVSKVRAELLWLLPQSILELAEARVESLRWLGEHSIGGAPHSVLCFSEASGATWNLFVDARTSYLTRVERLVAHPVEGDATEWYEFDGYRVTSGLALPTLRREARLEDASTWTREIHYDRIEIGKPPANERFALPPGVAPAAEAAAPQPVVVDLGKDIYLLELPEENTRVLFAVLTDHVIVLEAPLSSQTGERILAAVRKAAPGKPVRYLVMSHYHPHYTGGLRPFVHAGATLVTTPGNREHLAAIARRPQRLVPDALARQPREPDILVVSGSKVFEDKEHRLEVFDVGRLSNHTDEYLVFYFPAAKLLFEGDLGRLTTGEPDAPTAKRAKRIVDIVTSLHIDVERVVQSWPLRGSKTFATFKEIEGWSKLGDGH